MQDYSSLPHVTLAPGTRFVAQEGPAEPPPELAHLHDRGTTVMTDFRSVKVITTTPEQPIDDALEHMKASGVRLLLVVDGERRVVGLITARDIQGERPVAVVREQSIPHAQVTVAHIMTPQAAIEVLDYLTVHNARVGDVVATLHALERQHALVAEIDPATRGQTLRGLFSTTQISRQLGHDVSEDVRSAHTLAEMVQEIR